MRIWLISGKAGHGKDEVGKMLVKKLQANDKKVVVAHFADLVKEYARLYWNWDGNKNEDGRALLQYIGTTLMRTYNDQYWGRIIGEFLDAVAEQELFTDAIIPDWRFISEYDAICNTVGWRWYNDVITIRVNRYENGHLYDNNKLTEEQKNHISECELDDFCFQWEIENHTLEELDESVDSILDFYIHL